MFYLVSSSKSRLVTKESWMNFLNYFETKKQVYYTLDEAYFKGYIGYDIMIDGKPLQIGHDAKPQVEFLKRLKSQCSKLKFDKYLAKHI